MIDRKSESVVVVGAGIIGIACAHYLHQDGYAVTVVDKGVVGEGCSFRNCGHILPSHILPLNSWSAVRQGLASLLNPRAPFKIKPTLLLETLGWFWQFARHCNPVLVHDNAIALKRLLDSSFNEFKTLPALVRDASEWRESGLLYAFKGQRELDKFAETENVLSDTYGVSAQYRNSRELIGDDPSLSDDLAGGFLYADDAQVSPEALLQNWTKYLKREGVAFREQEALTSVISDRGAVSAVRTSSGELAADHVVLAAGAYCGPLVRLFDGALPVIPGKGYSVTLEGTAHIPSQSIVLPECNIAITPFDEALRVGSMMEFVGFDDAIPTYRIDQLTNNISPYFSKPLGGKVTLPWTGWRPMTWDGLPIIGRLKQLQNVIVATGHSMIGLMTAPATGKLVSELLSEQKTHLACEAYSPTRFNA